MAPDGVHAAQSGIDRRRALSAGARGIAAELPRPTIPLPRPSTKAIDPRLALGGHLGLDEQRRKPRNQGQCNPQSPAPGKRNRGRGRGFLANPAHHPRLESGRWLDRFQEEAALDLIFGHRFPPAHILLVKIVMYDRVAILCQAAPPPPRGRPTRSPAAEQRFRVRVPATTTRSRDSARGGSRFIRAIEVRRQREQPGGERRVPPPGAKVAVGTQKRLLRQILRPAAVEAIPVGEIHQRPLPPFHDGFERIGISVEDRLHGRKIFWACQSSACHRYDHAGAATVAFSSGHLFFPHFATRRTGWRSDCLRPADRPLGKRSRAKKWLTHS